MDHDEAVRICESMPGAWPDNPWGPEGLVYKIGPAERAKIFCFLGSDAAPDGAVSLKADPGIVPILHGNYQSVSSPRYLDKNHWIAVALDGDMPDDELESLIEASHELILTSLPKRIQREILDADGPA